jgi:ribosomal protein S18 acetylase RimI-like enzyme
LIVRPATLSDVDGIARVHVQAWRESYRELIPQATLDALSVEKRAAQWRHTLGNPDRTTFVAEDGSAVCGFVSGGGILWSGLSTGSEVSALYLLDAAKRRGVGRTLFQAELITLAGCGFTSTGLWVLTGNIAARRFYETMGGRPAETRTDTMGGLALEEVAYVWNDLAAYRG